MKKLILFSLLVVPLLAQSVSGLLSRSGYLDNRQRSILQRGWDNRPILRLFIANENCDNANNPGGYSIGGNCIPDTSDPEVFLAALQDGTTPPVSSGLNDYLDLVDAMDPPPQGLLVWDPEGVQFANEKYTGHPSVIPLLQPDFDVIADDFFAAITSRGYAVGMTLRPTRMRIGDSLPPCHLYPEQSLIYFHAMSLAYTDRAWTCNQTTFAWTEIGGFNRAWHSEVDAMEGIFSDALYAYQRWGAGGNCLFYVDSTIYAPAGTSFNISQQAWRKIQSRLPDCKFFPENMDSKQTFRYGAGYLDDLSALGNTSPHPRLIFIGLSHTLTEENKAPLAQYVAAGSILVFDPGATEIAYVEEVYALAAAL